MSTGEFELDEAYYPKLLNVARSAGLDLSDNPSKDELVKRLTEAGVERVGFDEWEMDGEDLDLQPVQSNSGSDGPRDKTVLYCLTRKETTPERVEEIRTALEGIGYELRKAGSEETKYAIVLPAESAEDPESESGDGDEGETSTPGEEREESGEDREESEFDLAEMTREELYEMARAKDVDGRSDMSKEELVSALDGSE